MHRHSKERDHVKAADGSGAIAVIDYTSRVFASPEKSPANGYFQ
jgi:hypothetical protein